VELLDRFRRLQLPGGEDDHALRFRLRHSPTLSREALHG
jgi:hypothetical protein